jgi:ABC-2 type transport system permease protein
MLGDAHISLSPAFFLSVVLGHILSFAMVTMLSMIALFTQEAMSIFELYYLPALLLSGSVFPVSVMPAWAQSIAHVLPFYVTAGAPTEILIGRVPSSGIPAIIATQIAWIAIAYVGFRLLWSRGLTRYAGAGN